MGVRVEMPTNAPMVLLRERAGEGRIVPIYIGAPEATAIALALDGVGTPRPMTHDLMRDIFEALSVDMERVVVTALQDKTFFAEIYLVHDGETHIISSRPSDAIALAVRTGTPIYADESVVEEVGYLESAESAQADEDLARSEEVVEEFKEFERDTKRFFANFRKVIGR